MKEEEMLRIMIKNVEDDLKSIQEKTDKAMQEKQECFNNY